MTILVSGASGRLGRIILDRLLARGVPASELVAGARDPRKLADLRARGIRTVVIDYDDPATLRPALQGIDRFVLVSVTAFETSVHQHDAVIEAAAAADLQALAYTSVYRADESALPLAPVHAAAERAIAAAGIPSVILRNTAYAELYLAPVARARQTGVIRAATGDGRIAAATRADLGDAAAVAIMDDAHLGEVLELAGDTSFSSADLAALAGSVLGRHVEYEALTHEQLLAGLLASGLDPRAAASFAAVDAAVAAGDLDSSDRTLSGLIGRPTTSLEQLLRASL